MRIILADPYLTSYAGHSYSYLHLLAEAVERRGHRAVIAGARMAAAAFLAEAGIAPVFSPYPTDPPWFEGRVAAVADADLKRLQELVAPGPDDHVIFNTVRYFHLCPIANWMRSLPREKRPTLSIILHYTAMGAKRPIRAATNGYRHGLAALAALSGEADIRIIADTEELVDEIQPLGSMPIGLAPIPPVGSFAASTSADERRSRAPRPLRIAFAGEARQGKGFLLLGHVSHALKADIAAGKVVFSAQIHRFGGRPWAARRVAERLRQDGVEMIDRPLSPTEYADFITGADVLLLPYLAPAYRRQSSGVFIDAAVSGKVSVVPRESWMGRFVARDGGGVTFPSPKPASVVAAVHQAIAQFDRLQTQAEHNQIAFRRFHSTENLVRVLIDGRTGSLS